MSEVERFAHAMLDAIDADLVASIVPTPADFAELHDYVDANDYAVAAAEELYGDWRDEHIDLFNQAVEVVDLVLAERARTDRRPRQRDGRYAVGVPRRLPREMAGRVAPGVVQSITSDGELWSVAYDPWSEPWWPAVGHYAVEADLVRQIAVGAAANLSKLPKEDHDFVDLIATCARLAAKFDELDWEGLVALDLLPADRGTEGFSLDDSRLRDWIAARAAERGVKRQPDDVTLDDLDSEFLNQALARRVQELSDAGVLRGPAGWRLIVWPLEEDERWAYLVTVGMSDDAAAALGVPALLVSAYDDDVRAGEPVRSLIDGVVATANRLLPAARAVHAAPGAPPAGRTAPTPM